jgi:hypothetical protein
MLRIIALSLFAALLAIPTAYIQAQSVDTLWTKTYWCGSYDSVGNVSETADHGFIMTTVSVLDGRTDYDLSLIKTDSLGVVEWTKYYGSTIGEGGLYVFQTLDGGYLVGGQSKLTGSSGGAGGMWVVKTDAAGDTVWTYAYCPDNRVAYALHAIQLADSSYAITGFINRSATFGDAFILRLDKDGGFLDYDDYGNNYTQEGKYIAQMPDSGFMVAGTFRHTYTTEEDWWVVRTDKNLNLLWDSSYALTSGTDDLGGACLTDDGLVMAGWTITTGHIVKIDFDGHTVWSKTFALGRTEERYNSITATSDGGFMVGGLANEPGYRRDYIFVRLNSEGDTLWTYMVGGGDDDHGRSVIQTYDGNFVMAGKSSSWVNGRCTWLVKIGAPGCCVDRVGDVNGIGGDEPSIGDVAMLIDALFISWDVAGLPCLSEADVNQSGGAATTESDITISDISVLIDYLFITGPSLGLHECL